MVHLLVVVACPCEAEVPFGQLSHRFLGRVVVIGNACCFRFGRVAKRNGAIAVR